MKNTSFLRHRGPVTCAAHVPNSNTIISSGYDNAVGLFDASTGEVTLLGYHQHLVNRVTVNDKGTYAVSASSDYNLYVWDLNDKKLLQVLKGHDDDVEDFVFIDDNLGASVSRDWRIILWDLTTGTIRRIMLGHEKDVLSINHFDGKLYTSGDDMTLRVWDVETGQQLSTIGPFETETDTCAIDGLHNRIILGCDDGVIRVFDIENNTIITSINGHESAIKKVAVSPINGDILSAAYDQKIIIWDHKDFSQKQQLQSHAALWERSFNWSSDGQKIFAGTFDGTVLGWDATTGQSLFEIGNNHQHAGNACFNDVASQNNDSVVLVSDDGHVRIGQLTADTAQWQQQTLHSDNRILMNAVTFCHSEKNIITGAHNQNLYIYDNNDLRKSTCVSLQEGPVNCIRTSHLKEHKGEVFVACYSGTLAHLSADGTVINKINAHDNAIKALALHPTKALGVSCCAEGGLVSWSYDGQILNKYQGHMAIIDDLDIDPSGQLIASAGRDFTLKIHGLNDGVLYHSIHLGKRSPKSLCFVSTDVVIVTNYWGELLRVSLKDGSILRKTIAANGISSIVPHGKHYAVSSYDGAVYLVEQENLQVLNRLRSMTQQVEAPAFV